MSFNLNDLTPEQLAALQALFGATSTPTSSTGQPANILRTIPVQAPPQSQAPPPSQTPPPLPESSSSSSAPVALSHSLLAHLQQLPQARSAPVTLYQSPRASMPAAQTSASGARSAAVLSNLRNAPGLSAQVNSQRLASSSRTSTPRRRGPAQGRPTIQGGRKLEDSLTNPDQNGVPQDIRIRGKILPPVHYTQADRDFPSERRAEWIFYTSRRSSVDQFLTNHSLLYDVTIPLDTRFVDFALHLQSQMSSSLLGYTFARPEEISEFAHENVRLQPLRARNRALPQEDGQSRMVPAILNSTDTLRDIFRDRRNFTFTQAYLPSERRVELYFAVTHYPLEAISPLAPTLSAAPRLCLSRVFYERFCYDLPHLQFTPLANTEDCPGCGDACLGGLTFIDVIPIQNATGPTPTLTDVLDSWNPVSGSSSSSEARTGALTEVSSPSTPPTTPATPVLAAVPTTSLQRAATLPSATISHLPLKWPAPEWSRPSTTAPIAQFDTVEDLADVACIGAWAGHNLSHATPLRLRGFSVSDLACRLRERINRALDEDDFTEILSPIRSFELLGHTASGDEVVRSSGEGIEREALEELAAPFLSLPNPLLSPRLDDTHSVFASPLAHLSSEDEGRQIAVAGAAIALLLINGAAPAIFSPLFFHWLVHGCDLRSISMEFLQEWHPTFATFLAAFINAGATGDISQFSYYVSTYGDQEVANMRARSQAQHDACIVLMLHRALFGSEAGPSHFAIRRFRQGFMLSCRSGFSLLKLVTAFTQGAEALWCHVWTSTIKGFNSISDAVGHQIFTSVPAAHRSVSIEGNSYALDALVVRFLRGRGVPCSAHLERERPTLLDGALRELRDVDSEACRARMFHRAATGISSIQPGSRIKIRYVGDHDAAYRGSDDLAVRELCISKGRIAFQTCTRQVTILASHFIKLAEAEYDTSSPDQPHSAFEAIDSWLFLEIAGAIGNHMHIY